MKIVGKQSRIPATPEEAVLKARKIIAEAFRVSPIKKPRGFVVKFITLLSVPSVSFDSLAPARLALRANLRLLYLNGPAFSIVLNLRRV